jgi:hypothetical protein
MKTLRNPFGNQPHILTPDYAHPIKAHELNLPHDRVADLVGVPRNG